MKINQILFLAIIFALLAQTISKSKYQERNLKKFIQLNFLDFQKLHQFLEEPPEEEKKFQKDKESSNSTDKDTSEEENPESQKTGDTSIVNIKCLWVNKYNVYSLQKLQNEEKDYEQTLENNDKIIFNFCQNTNTKINNKESQSTFLWEKNETLIKISGSIEGNSNDKNKWSEQEDENGNYIMISFAKGESCSATENHKTYLKIYCNSDEEDFLKNIKFSGFEENSCKHIISTSSIYGCALTDTYLLKKILHKYWFIFATLFIIIGAFLCFFGHKIIWLTAILISGMMSCFVISIIILNLLPSLIKTETSLWILLGVGFAIGAIIGILIRAKVKIVVCLLGAAMGYTVALFVYQIIQSFIEWKPQVIYYITIGVCIIIGILLGLWIYNSILIIGTAILGGYIAMRGFTTIFGEYIDEGQFADLMKSGELEQLEEIRNGWVFAYLGLWLFLVFGGIIYQCKQYKKSLI